MPFWHYSLKQLVLCNSKYPTYPFLLAEVLFGEIIVVERKVLYCVILAFLQL